MSQADRSRRKDAGRTPGTALRIALLVIPLIAASGCPATYTGPTLTGDESQYTVTVPRPYDNVWDDLIEHVSSSSFAIKHVERASGLVSFDFVALENVGTYVDCGIYSGKGRSMPYLEWVVRQGYRMRLTGWMNIYVRGAFRHTDHGSCDGTIRRGSCRAKRHDMAAVEI